MEGDIVGTLQTERRKQSECNADAAMADSQTSFPSIEIKSSFRDRLERRSKRIVVTSPNAPITLYATKEKGDEAPVAPSSVRRKRVLKAIDRAVSIAKLKSDKKRSTTIPRATSTEKDMAILHSPGNSHRSRSALNRFQSDESVDRWSVSFNTTKTMDLTESDVASSLCSSFHTHGSPHTLGSSSRHKHRLRQSFSQSKSSLDSTPEISELFSPSWNDSKQSLTLSELGSKRSISISESISELGNSFSTRPPRSSHLLTCGTSSSHLRTSGPPSSNFRGTGTSSSHLRGTGSSSAHVRSTGTSTAHLHTSGTLSAHVRSTGASSSHLRISGSSSSHLRTSGSSSNLRHNGSSSHLRYNEWNSSILPSSVASRPRSGIDARSSRSAKTRSSIRSEKIKKGDKKLRMAQSSSAASLEHYGKLSQRRSSATQESLSTARTMLLEELESPGSNCQQRTSINSSTQRSSRSFRSGSRRSAFRTSGSQSHRQGSVQEVAKESSSSDDDELSSLEDSPSLEEHLRLNLLGFVVARVDTDEVAQKRRSSSTKARNDMKDSSLMTRRGSRDRSISIDSALTYNSKSLDGSDLLYSTLHDSSASISLLPRGSRRGTRRTKLSTKTSGNSKESARTTGNSKWSSLTAGNSKTETKKRASPRVKSDAASLRGVPKTIEFIVKAETKERSPENSLDVSTKSNKTSSHSSRSSSHNKSIKVSPISMTSPLNRTARRYSKAASAGARRLANIIVKKKTKKESKKDQDQKSSASHGNESLPSLFGTALCLDLDSSNRNPTTSPFMQYDVALNDSQPRSASRRLSVGSFSRASSTARLKNSFGSLDGSGDFILTEEEGGTSGGITSPSVSLASDFISSDSSLLPNSGLLPNHQRQKKIKKKFRRKKTSAVKNKKRSYTSNELTRSQNS